MLARTFKTPRQLGITKKEFDALIKTMQMLERGEAKYIKRSFCSDYNDEVMAQKPMIDAKRFSMHYAARPVEDRRGNVCGTVACIGGWVAYYMGKKTLNGMEQYVFGQKYGPIGDLYFPGRYDGVYDKCTPGHAAQAIGNFLATGHPHWEDIIPGVKLACEE